MRRPMRSAARVRIWLMFAQERLRGAESLRESVVGNRRQVMKSQSDDTARAHRHRFSAFGTNPSPIRTPK
jgi:hypothetical protein